MTSQHRSSPGVLGGGGNFQAPGREGSSEMVLEQPRSVRGSSTELLQLWLRLGAAGERGAGRTGGVGPRAAPGPVPLR